MKLSEHSLNVLRNFAGINSGIVLRKGNIQRVISDDDAIFAEVEIEDDIPQTFGIYDLNQFLGNISTLGHPELSFNDKLLTMDGDGIVTGYYGCDPSIPKTPPDGDWSLKNPDASFELSESTLSKLLKIAATNVLPNFSISGKNNELLVKVHQKANVTSNFSTFKVGTYSGEDFTTTFKVANLRMLPGDYSVELKIGKFAKFTNKKHKLFYLIAAETK